MGGLAILWLQLSEATLRGRQTKGALPPVAEWPGCSECVPIRISRACEAKAGASQHLSVLLQRDRCPGSHGAKEAALQGKQQQDRRCWKLERGGPGFEKPAECLSGCEEWIC